MKSLVTLLTAFVLTNLSLANPIPEGAYPLEIISSRPITERDTASIEERSISSCPPGGNLPSDYLAPSLMVLVSAKLPNVKFGKTEIPMITPNDFCTIFNLEIGPDGVDKTCTLEFLFPKFPQTLSWYEFEGPGHFTFTGYAIGAGAQLNTTYANQPAPGPSPPNPPPVIVPGNAYKINVGPCGIPTGVPEVTVSGMLCSKDTTLKYKQSSSTCPIGFFVGIS